MTKVPQIALLFGTIRYLTPAQIWHRGSRLARQRWLRYSGAQVTYPTHWRYSDPKSLYLGLADLSSEGPWGHELQSVIQVAEAAAEGQFSFLNQSEALDKIGWHNPTVSQLWRYQLHYFHYVQDLLVWACSGSMPQAYAAFHYLVISWNEANQRYQGDGWHPYTISLRTVNWVQAIGVFREQLAADPEFQSQVRGSLYAQAQYLFRNLELDVRGNHLLENLRALCWLGIAFTGEEPERWANRGLELLKREVQEQVLDDGGHFERTPGYHLIVLKDLLEIALWQRRNNRSVPGWLRDAIERMLDFLLVLLPPNGTIPLLKDTAWDLSPDPFDLLAAGALFLEEPKYKVRDHFGLYPFLLFGQAGWQTFQQWPIADELRLSYLLKSSGWGILRDDVKGDYCIIDVGKPCPDYLPAHAHADLLSYELSIGGDRVIVDSGVYVYVGGPWRDYFRSTRAHNTVEIGGENQSEVWASFRVARRAQPGPVFFRRSESSVLLQASHNGYERQRPSVTHRRTLVWCKRGFWLFVDELVGRGHASVESHIHLHPNVGFQEISESLWRFTGTRENLWLVGFGYDNHRHTIGQETPHYQGWYSEEFGRLVPNQVLTLEKQASLPSVMGYVIFQGTPGDVELSAHGGAPHVTIAYQEGNHMLALPTQSAPSFA